jgi:ABC-type methionine transport system ATPase subunit
MGVRSSLAERSWLSRRCDDRPPRSPSRSPLRTRNGLVSADVVRDDGAVSLLALSGVTMRRARGKRQARASSVLCDVSLTIEAGEVVAIWGLRRSGRTTILQVAAGMSAPTAGNVCFAGVDLARRPMLGAGGGIGYAFATFDRAIAESVLEHVSAPLLGGRGTRAIAEARASHALGRVGAARCAELGAVDLEPAAAIRVGIARALVTQPSLLLLDEPTKGIPPARASDALLSLIGSIARDDGIAVLMTTGDGADLAGVNRALTLDGGRLRGATTPPAAQVIHLRGTA